ncbi:MAG: hypothetical protein IKI77_06080 [Oscillospiraceae bacterium]|nr:hypothetical protein [Oscillospiraceae bacterium]
MEIKKYVSEGGGRSPGYSAWYCCKADDGKYYAVISASSPMICYKNYYVITKAIYDACDPSDPDTARKMIGKGILVYEYSDGPMGSPEPHQVHHPEYMDAFGWYGSR